MVVDVGETVSVYGELVMPLIVRETVPSEYTIVHGAVPVRLILSVVEPPAQMLPGPDNVALAKGVTVSTSVATESQPAAPVSVTEYVPGELYVWPFHV